MSVMSKRGMGPMHMERAVFAHAVSLPCTCIQILVRRSCHEAQHGHQGGACGAGNTCTRDIADQGLRRCKSMRRSD